MDEEQSQPEANREIGIERPADDADTRLSARLKQILETPGISDKDRRLVERNLKRLVEAHDRY